MLSSRVNVSLNAANFLGHYLVEPTARELSKKDSKVALVASIILGFFTAGLLHLSIAFVRLCLRGRLTKLPEHSSTSESSKHKKMVEINNSTDFMNYVREHGAEITKIDKRNFINNDLILTDDQIKEVITLCPNLEKFGFVCEELSVETAAALKTLTSLRALGITVVTELDKKIEEVKTLKPEVAKEIAEIPELTLLELQMEKITPEITQALQGAQKLEVLRLRLLFQIDEPSAKALSQIPNVNSLTLDVLTFRNEEIKLHIFNELPKMKSLKKLKVRRLPALISISPPKRMNAKAKRKMGNLEVEQPKVPNPIAVQLAKIPNLEELSFPILSTIDVKTVELLGAIRNLKYLDLPNLHPKNEEDGKEMDAKVIEALRKLENSKEIEVFCPALESDEEASEKSENSEELNNPSFIVHSSDSSSEEKTEKIARKRIPKPREFERVPSVFTLTLKR